jgi:glycosyltransferase involved in cell wall biosynthesis
MAKKGFDWRELPIDRWGMNPIRDLMTIARCVSVYRRERPDLCHHFTIKPVLYGTLAAQLTGIPAVVNSITGLGYLFEEETFGARILRRLAEALLRRTKGNAKFRFVFQQADDLSYFVQSGALSGMQARIIEGSGVNLEEFPSTPDPQGVPVITFVGRMIRRKGVGDLIRAEEILRAKGLKAKVMLVGPVEEGNPSAIPRDEIEKWVRQGNIEWLGYREDVQRIYSRSHIVALPTYYGEGIPKSLLEAAASARPIVASDIPGCREIVYNGENGILVPPRDPPALADALERLIEAPELRVRMGERSREIVSTRFDSQRIDGETISLYAELVPELKPKIR